MRLGYVIGAPRGGVDRLLAEVAARLDAGGWRLSGVIQVNAERPGRRCDMDLAVLGGQTVRISQCLGPHSRGCRLDPVGLETAVGQVAAALTADPPQLLLINKFGKAEIGGRGFRPVIAQALGSGVPVLLGVSGGNLDGFAAFAEGLGEALPAELDKVLDWCRDVAGQPA